MTEEDAFTACLNKMSVETVNLLQSFPPQVENDSSGVLSGSLDLVLYRNLANALEFCFNSGKGDGRFSPEQQQQLATFAKTKVLPAYVNYFNAHFGEGGEKSFYFFVRQENNSSWAKLIWLRIKQLYTAKLASKPQDSHELGVLLPGDVLDALARLLDIFLPRDAAKFEMLGFDVRSDDPLILSAILQASLTDRRDPLSAKNAFYILNRIISFSREAVISSSSIFSWNANDSPTAVAWEQFIVSFAAVQESQVHLVLPLLPVLNSALLKGSCPLGLSWWRVLIQKGLTNDSIPVRRVILHSVLSLGGRELCSPDGLDFCLGDLMSLGLDPNSGFFVTPQAITVEAGEVVDLGEMVGLFYGRLISAYAAQSAGHGRAIVNELLAAIEAFLRVPVSIIYTLKAFSHLPTPFPAISDSTCQCISRIAQLPSLHNQRARLLVKWQLMELLMALADAEGISFAQLSVTLNDLVLESMRGVNPANNTGNSSGSTLTADSENFSKVASWLNDCFGATFMRENMTISLQGFFSTSDSTTDSTTESTNDEFAGRVKGLKVKAQVLATMCVFSIGAADGRFVAFCRALFEQMAMITADDHPHHVVPAFILFLAVNETVQAVLRGENDLITQLNLTNKIFEWLAFLDSALFGPEMSVRVDFVSSLVLLDALALFADRAADNDEKQLLQFLDMLAFRLSRFIDRKAQAQRDRQAEDQVEVGFGGILTLHAALTALSAVLAKLGALKHVRPGDQLATPESIQRVIRYRLERPAGLSEAEWDEWPSFVTAFTQAKWKCVEAMAVSVPEVELLSVLASCTQALEVSKYGGTLAILKCTGTLINLIVQGGTVEPAFDALFDRLAEIMSQVLEGQAETQRWFDLYADAFVRVAFSPAILALSEQREGIMAVLHRLFDLFVDELGPKRRGIVALISSRLGAHFVAHPQTLNDAWKEQLLRLLVYGPVRGSAEETVAARVTKEHVPDSDYQVRLHAITVLNQLKDVSLLKDLLQDLVGRQEALGGAQMRRKMFPGDANHRVKLRSWAAILLIIGILTRIPDALDVDYAQSELIPMLWKFVGEETMDSTRVFMEWALGLVYLKFPGKLIAEDLIALRTCAFDGFSCQIVTALSVALLVGKKIAQVDAGVAKNIFFAQMADYILPLLAHNNHLVRMRAIHAFKVLYQQKCLMEKCDVLGYKLLSGFIENTEHCRKFIKKVENDLVTSASGLDPIDDFNLDYIFGKLMRNGGIDGEAIEYYAFMNYLEEEGTVPFYNSAHEIVKLSRAQSMPTISDSSSVTAQVDIEELFKDFQQKIDIYSPYGAGELTTSTSTSTNASDALDTEIIVIGSLVDKLPNLAGLARTCEIFGVKRLYVPNAADLALPDFVNVAMTAEKWLDLRQLAPEEVPNFLKELKERDGFKVVALEQTANSVSLQSYSFPKRTCLVLGNERMGVPAEILHLVDDCVEIPQFGRVRSLNVHVSGSIAIWKAREQDLM